MTEFLKNVGHIFYIASPNETTFERVSDVPNYLNEAVPVYLVFILLEFIICRAQGKRTARLNDGLSSMGHGMLFETSRIFLHGVEFVGYEWIYQYRILDLDWSSPWTWLLAAIVADFGYYWFHRAAHEVNFAWASHQVHHSSEDYNYTTALRQSAVQSFFKIGLQQPFALLGVPLPAYVVHLQFNLLFQFWIHTEAVSTIGPLEWLLNSPSHHRVHHGANKWCLDKNYAGVLMIWDRMFGTYQDELKHEPIVYGLVDQPKSFNPLWHQVHYFEMVLRKCWSMDTWSDKLKAVFYGPGWAPGSPRLGNPDDIPDETPQREKYNPRMATLMDVYLFSHYVILTAAHQMLVYQYMTFSSNTVMAYLAFIATTLASIGAMYDEKLWGPPLEALRCFLLSLYLNNHEITSVKVLNDIILGYFGASALFWASKCLETVINNRKEKQA